MTAEPEINPEQTLRTDERLLSYQEIAPRLGVSVSTVRRWVDQKRIPAIHLGHQVVRFHYPTVLKHLNQQKPAE